MSGAHGQVSERGGTSPVTFWNGYMEGAVRSGERAPAEVLAKP